MAPQEMQKLIPQENSSSTLDLNEYSSEEAISQLKDEHVIVVQPYSKANKTGGSGKGKGSKEKGKEEPRNCIHLEAALFFFGVAGMIVSVVMLLQHLVIKYF